MCRITGFWDLDFHGDYDREATVLSMRDTMAHGGPDDFGAYCDPHTAFALGHRRLSIIDLSSAGHQPYLFENLALCYNGEIYNYASLAQQLENEGYSFESHSDSEVIIKSFHRWGTDCVKRFRGMWAFAIWDNRAQKLYLCRDRAGIKPLYWYFHEGVLLFGSELKCFYRHPRFSPLLDDIAFAEYLQNGYISAPDTILKHTQKLLPAHWLELDATRSLTVHSYWNLPAHVEAGISEKNLWLARSAEEVRDELESNLREAFELHMVADVPVGIFLSGGIDSSLVTALLQTSSGKRLKTFTIGFEQEEFNEAVWAGEVARHLGTEHTELYCTSKEAADIVASLPEIYDEPFADSSSIATVLVSRLAAKQVKAALSADGGDEQFYGYNAYPTVESRWNRYGGKSTSRISSLALQLISPGIVQALLSKHSTYTSSAADRFIKFRTLLGVKDRLLFYDTTLHTIMQPEVNQLLERPSDGFSEARMNKLNEALRPGMNYAQQMMQMDMRSYLPDDLLVKVDRATMSVALEGRVPFLDHKVMEYAARMPGELKYREGQNKWILKQILYKHVPAQLIDRPKRGFMVPIEEWFRNDLRDFYSNYLGDEKIKRAGLFRPKVVGKMREAFFRTPGMHARKLWLLMMFMMWKEKYLPD